jgi:hypothetical protein
MQLCHWKDEYEKMFLPLSLNGLRGIVVTGDVRPSVHRCICPVSLRQFQGEWLVESNQLFVCMLGVSVGRFLSKIAVFRFSIWLPRPHHLEIGFRRFQSRRMACMMEFILSVSRGRFLSKIGVSIFNMAATATILKWVYVDYLMNAWVYCSDFFWPIAREESSCR